MPRLTTARVRAGRAEKQFRERERLRETTLFAVLGNSAGAVETTTVGVVWIRLHGDPNQVTRALASSSVPCRDEDADTTVKVEKLKKLAGARYRIVGLASEVYPADPRGGLVAPHGWEHGYDDFNTGGSDPVHVHRHAIIPLQAHPT